MPVNSVHPDYQAHRHLWQRARDAAAGEEAIKARCLENNAPDSLSLAALSYLPRLSGQRDREYAAYLGRAAWYGATGRTLEGLVGTVFSQDPAITLSAALRALRDNADRAGTPLQLMAKELFRELLLVGRYGMLVDMPAADRAQLPYVCGYRAESMLNWRVGLIEDRIQLARVVLQEQFSEPDPKDEWRDLLRWRFRVLELDEDGFYRVRLFRYPIGADGGEVLGQAPIQDGEPILPRRRGERLREIPFLFVGPHGFDPAVGRLPLLDLINANLHHFRLSAELNHGLFVTSMPTPVVIGDTTRSPTAPGTRRIGSQVAWELPPGADAKFLEFAGSGLSAIRDELQADEARMVLLGARLLEPQKRAAEAAEALRLRQAGEAATLASVADTASWGLSRVLGFAAEWVGESPDENTVTLSQSFAQAGLSEDEALTLVERWQRGGATLEDVFHALQSGGKVAPGETFDTWRRKLTDQGPLATVLPEAA